MAAFTLDRGHVVVVVVVFVMQIMIPHWQTNFIYLSNQVGPIEIKNLFFKGDLAKIGSSINTKVTTETHWERNMYLKSTTAPHPHHLRIKKGKTDWEAVGHPGMLNH